MQRFIEALSNLTRPRKVNVQRATYVSRGHAASADV